MPLVSIGGMSLIPVGMAGTPNYIPRIGVLTGTTVDAANEACIMLGQVFWEDAGSHTVDTTGSSSLQWRSSSATFANAGTTVVVGLAAIDTANGPAPRAVNVADVITFDVSRSLTGGGAGIANGGWNTTVPTSGTKTIAHGDAIAFAVQATARAGADSIVIGHPSHDTGSPSIFPNVSTFVGGVYAIANALPNLVIVASDGTRGYIFGGSVLSVITGTAFNSGSAPNERGNVMTLPFAGKAHGFVFSTAHTSATGNFDLVLYSDPLGTPAAQRTTSFDANTLGTVSANSMHGAALFTSPYQFSAGQPLAAIFKPTTVNSITPSFITLADANHMNAYSLGTAAYAVNRSSGAFAAQNSNLERYQIGLLIETVDRGGSPVIGG